MNVRCCPGVSVRPPQTTFPLCNVQGTSVSPGLKARLAGTGSVIVTLVAVVLPSFFTVTVKRMVSKRLIWGGATLAMDTSVPLQLQEELLELEEDVLALLELELEKLLEEELLDAVASVLSKGSAQPGSSG